MIDSEYLRSLKIQKVFVGIGIEKLKDQLSTEEGYYAALFDETTRRMIWLTDDARFGHCIFVTETKGHDINKLLKIENTKAKSLYLWRIDGAMFKKYSKCDCALFMDEWLRMIEFKANAISQKECAVRGNCEKACDQLEMTYTYFCKMYKDAGLDIKNFFKKIDAMIVLNRTIPKDDAYHKSVKKIFAKKNRLKLHIENEMKLED